MIEIKHKQTGEVLLRVNADTLEGVSLNGVDLNGADLGARVVRGASLRGADLTDAHLEEATLADADLSGAILARANMRRLKGGGIELRGASLCEADLEGAVLTSASLVASLLWEANLRQTDLSFSSLSSACLIAADLEGARLIDTSLNGANLRGANLEGADLSSRLVWDAMSPHLPLKGACYDALMRWPAGFDPDQHGAVRDERALMNQTAPLYHIIPVPKQCRLLLTFESDDSEWRQGVRIGDTLRRTEMELTVDGHTAPGMRFWSDTSPRQVEISVKAPQGLVTVYNIWDPGNGHAISQIQGAGMKVEELETGQFWRYRCNDGHPVQTFDHLVFSLGAISPSADVLE